MLSSGTLDKMSSLVLVAITGLVGYFAIKTKPDLESFEAFYRSSYCNEKPAKKKGWLGGMVESLLNGASGKGSIPPTTVYDCVLFHVVLVKMDSKIYAYFLGVFGMWLPLIAPEANQTSTLPDRSAVDDSRCEKLRQNAVDLKAAGKNAEAGEKYEELAMLETDLNDRAEALENAAKCFKAAKQTEKSHKLLSSALEICQRNGRHVKAALLAESMGEVAPSQDAKIDSMRTAVQLFALANDRRSSQIKERLANLLAEGLKHREAAVFFWERSTELAEDPILMNSARKNMMLSLCCSHLSGVKDYDFPDWFVGSEEHKVLDSWCRYVSGEAEEPFKTTLDLPRWFHAIKPDSSLC